ncbi:hypothetical protein [Streptomyces sp. NPDC088350]|uniref:hypothetical protein n=1 Tax=Streptomyces sp. NPDC088350 TaxID=3365854 RepID=UPI0037F29EA4
MRGGAVDGAQRGQIAGEDIARGPLRVQLDERQYLLGRGFDDTFIDASEISRAYVRDGGNEVVTEDVREVLGRPARTYQEWVEDHREMFGEV